MDDDTIHLSQGDPGLLVHRDVLDNVEVEFWQTLVSVGVMSGQTAERELRRLEKREYRRRGRSAADTSRPQVYVDAFMSRLNSSPDADMFTFHYV